MEKQIREIIAQHVGGTYEAKQKCAEEILRLFSVSKSSCRHKWKETPSDDDGELQIYTCVKCGKKDVC